MNPYNQCYGSGSVGSVCFWASWIRIRHYFVRIQICIRIRILPSTSKKLRKTLISPFFVTSYWLLSLKTDVNVPSKNIKQKTLKENLLSVTEEKSRLRIRKSVVRIRGSGSVSNCHRSTTLLIYQRFKEILRQKLLCYCIDLLLTDLTNNFFKRLQNIQFM